VSIVLFGIAWLYGASMIHSGLKNDAIGEAGVPYAIGIILVGIGCYLAVTQFLALRATPQVVAPLKDKGDEPEYTVSNVRPLLMFAICMAWVVLLEPVGFMIVTAIVLALILWLMEFRRPVPLASLSIISSIFLFVVFDVLLRINLPGGVLGPITDTWHL
jgi:putative tricarboxylic transport membrane protein